MVVAKAGAEVFGFFPQFLDAGLQFFCVFGEAIEAIVDGITLGSGSHDCFGVAFAGVARVPLFYKGVEGFW